jgi:hypothetical protein
MQIIIFSPIIYFPPINLIFNSNNINLIYTIPQTILKHHYTFTKSNLKSTLNYN